MTTTHSAGRQLQLRPGGKPLLFALVAAIDADIVRAVLTTPPVRSLTPLRCGR